MLIYRWQASRLKRWDYNFTNLMLITTSKEEQKRKLVVKSAVTLRALDTFFSTTGYPSESSLLRNLRNVWKQKKDCFCLRMWRDLNKTLGVHFIEVSVKRELAVVTEPVNWGPCRKETINLVSLYLLNCGPYLLLTFPSPPSSRVPRIELSRAQISLSFSRFNAWHEGYRDRESFVDNLPSASYASCYTIIVSQTSPQNAKIAPKVGRKII